MALRQRGAKYSLPDTGSRRTSIFAGVSVSGHDGSVCRDQHQYTFAQSSIRVDTRYRCERVIIREILQTLAAIFPFLVLISWKTPFP